MDSKIYIVLDNIRSAHNVGSIFRTADAAGVSEIVLCGTTPVPIDRFGRLRSDIRKVALGAEQTVKWKYEQETADAINRLKKRGVHIVGVEQTPDAKNYKELHITADPAFVFGSETDGISNEALALCDEVVEIPMRGTKESLNVSVAAGIILFQHVSN